LFLASISNALTRLAVAASKKSELLFHMLAVVRKENNGRSREVITCQNRKARG
jgi:hypothetical protein